MGASDAPAGLASAGVLAGDDAFPEFNNWQYSRRHLDVALASQQCDDKPGCGWLKANLVERAEDVVISP